ncbi:hypothetical protein BHE74_00017614 [Ensete ventricosum]|nr:hypothetical protein BHE74_00017614 [Ensete ventricosum]
MIILLSKYCRLRLSLLHFQPHLFFLQGFTFAYRLHTRGRTLSKDWRYNFLEIHLLSQSSAKLVTLWASSTSLQNHLSTKDKEGHKKLGVEKYQLWVK